MNRSLDSSHRTFDFGVTGVADEDQRAPLRDVTLALSVYFRHQRARRIEHRQRAAARIVLDSLRDTVRAEHRHRARRDLGNLFDEARAFGLEAFDDVPIVYDLVPH